MPFGESRVGDLHATPCPGSSPLPPAPNLLPLAPGDLEGWAVLAAEGGSQEGGQRSSEGEWVREPQPPGQGTRTRGPCPSRSPQGRALGETSPRERHSETALCPAEWLVPFQCGFSFSFPRPCASPSPLFLSNRSLFAIAGVVGGKREPAPERCAASEPQESMAGGSVWRAGRAVLRPRGCLFILVPNSGAEVPAGLQGLSSWPPWPQRRCLAQGGPPAPLEGGTLFKRGLTLPGGWGFTLSKFPE